MDSKATGALRSVDEPFASGKLEGRLKPLTVGCGLLLILAGLIAHLRFFSVEYLPFLQILPLIPVQEADCFIASGGALIALATRTRWLGVLAVAWLAVVVATSLLTMFGVANLLHMQWIQSYMGDAFRPHLVSMSASGMVCFALVAIFITRRLFARRFLATESLATGGAILMLGIIPLVQALFYGYSMEAFFRDKASTAAGTAAYMVLSLAFIVVGVAEIRSHKSRREQKQILLLSLLGAAVIVPLYALSDQSSKAHLERATMRPLEYGAGYIDSAILSIDPMLDILVAQRQQGNPSKQLIPLALASTYPFDSHIAIQHDQRASGSISCDRAGPKNAKLDQDSLQYTVRSCFDGPNGQAEAFEVTADLRAIFVEGLRRSGGGIDPQYVDLLAGNSAPPDKLAIRIGDTGHYICIVYNGPTPASSQILTLEFFALLLTMTLMFLVVFTLDTATTLSAAQNWTETVQNSTSAALVVVDENSTVISFNQVAQNLFPAIKKHTPLDSSITETTTNSAGKLGIGEYHLSLPSQGGKSQHIVCNIKQLSAAPFRRYLFTFSDVSEIVSLGQEADHERQRLGSILRATYEGIIGLDDTGHVVFANYAAEELLGYTVEELESADLRAMLSYTDSDQIAEEIEADISHGNAVSASLDYFKTKNGTLLPVRFTISPAAPSPDDPLNSVLVFSDATLELEHQRATQDHIKRLTQINDDLQTFNYVLAHDMREPARTVNVYAQLLENELGSSLSPDAQEHISTIREMAERLALRCDHLRNFLDASGAEVSLETLKASHIVKDAMTMLSHQISDQSANITIEGEAEIQGDRQTLTLVFQNLISNAVKYSNRSIVANIAVNISYGDNARVFVDVSDEGIGIEMRHADKIFQPFKRLHDAEFEGSGMGLALAKNLARRNQGDVLLLKSAPNHGATFRVQLQAARPKYTAPNKTIKYKTTEF